MELSARPLLNHSHLPKCFGQRIGACLVLGIALAAAKPAWAVCAAGGKTLFTCSTARDKRIEVCEANGQIEYSYGPSQARPEIVLRVPRSQVTESQWSSARSWNFHSLEVPNGSTTYAIFWGGNGASPATPQEGGVNVVAGDTVSATVVCLPQTITQAPPAQALASNLR